MKKHLLKILFAAILYTQAAAFSCAQIDNSKVDTDATPALVSAKTSQPNTLHALAPKSNNEKLTPEEQDAVEREQRLEELQQRRLSDAKNLKDSFDNLLQYVSDFSPVLGSLLGFSIFGTSVLAIAGSISIFALAWLFQHFIVAFIFNFFMRRGGDNIKNSKELFFGLQAPLRWLILLVSAHVSLMVVVHSVSALRFLSHVVLVMFLAIFFWGLIILADAVFKLSEEKLGLRYAATKNLFELGRKIVRYFLISICVLVVLDSCGANINAIIASLGIGGAALAFASKDTIANFFGSVSLIIDRPFVVGDWISAGGTEGIVENIGFRSTRIRTFPRTLVTIPNSILANENIENWTKRSERRANITIGLTYSTTADQMEQIVADLRSLLAENPKVNKYAGIRVHFTCFNSSSLDIEMIFYIKEVDAIPYADELQKINLQVMRAVAARNLSMAFPSRSLYVESLPPLK